MPLIFIVLLLTLLGACERTNSTAGFHGAFATVGNSETDAASAPIEVIDYQGRTVMLSTPAKRIVALSPHIVENLFSAGLGEKIVASVSYADYPAAAKNIPRIGGFSNFSVESIIAHQPDLVIGWASGFAGFAALRERLEQLGIAVYVDDPRSPHDIPRSIADFAQLGGSDKNWQAAVAQYTAQLQQLQQHPAVPNANVDSATTTDRARAKTQTLMDIEVSVFFEIWHRPLQTLNGEHMVSELIQLCGGRNIFADAAVIA
ncbi:MAG: ABC transporter substrate-binding protein, partial [Pseudomonadales bacterium]|nr:ABC transporter substrate-binding protein [Pseudomonadales bacterium]